MRVVELGASGWRNLADGQRLIFPGDARLNVLFGDNAQGKTNVLEAIHFLSAFRSFRTSQPADLIQRGAGRADIAATIASRELTRTVEVQLTWRPGTPSTVAAAEGGGVARTILVDGKPVRGTASAFGALSTVLFVPEDLALLRATPAARRRFLDFAVSSVARPYLREASDFQKVLRNRNAVLRARAPQTSSLLLDTYDEQLARTGAVIVERRRALLRTLEPHAQGFFAALHANLVVELSYAADPQVMQAATRAELERALRTGIGARRAVDARRGYSTFGPHLDDFEVRLEGRPAREHASQGQLRSLVLALKLAELVNVERATAELPVLLLDDVPSELDPARRGYLFGTLEDLTCQTILTVADRQVVPGLRHRCDFEVEAGRVVPVAQGR
jgi:DNA replication and repair protein RecF